MLRIRTIRISESSPSRPALERAHRVARFRCRRRTLAAAAVLAALGFGGAAVAVIDPFGAAAATHAEGSGGADPPAVATVKQGPLSSQVSTSGTLGYASPETVYGLLNGTITWLPPVGQVIKPGQTLYRVENNPVVLLDGAVPAYRNLSPGISDGPDVKELNQNLVALGFDPDHQITVNDTWQDATTAAVERWQASLDQTQTGTITLGQIVFLPGAQRITKLDATLGTGGGATGASSGSTSFTALGPLSVAPEFASYTPTTTSTSTTTTTSTTPTTPPTTTTTPTTTTPTTTTPTTTTPTTTTPTTTTPTTTAPHKPHKPHKPGKGQKPTKPGKPGHRRKPAGAGQHRRPTGNPGSPRGRSRSRTPQRTTGARRGKRTAGGARSGGARSGGARSGGARSGAAGGKSSGAGGGPRATPVLETTSTVRQVQVQLDASEQASVKVGDPAQITLPDNQTTPGIVTSIGAATSSSSGSGSGSGASGPTIPVNIALKHPQDAGGLDQAPVQVQITSAGVKRALIVPVTALLALSGGRYAVETIAANGSHHLVPVTLGLVNEADGVAQVTASGLSASEQIVVPST